MKHKIQYFDEPNDISYNESYNQLIDNNQHLFKWKILYMIRTEKYGYLMLSSWRKSLKILNYEGKLIS